MTHTVLGRRAERVGLVLGRAARGLVLGRAARGLVLGRAARGLASVALLLGARVEAQTLAARVAQAPDGVIRLQLDRRPGTCGDGRDMVGYRTALFARNFQTMGKWSAPNCVAGPVRVALSVIDGQVRQARTHVGGTWPSTGERVTDLGVVDAREASAYFFSLVPRLESGSMRDRVLLPAVLADDAPVIAPLLALARNADRATDTRRQAVMWLGLMGDASVIPALVEFARGDVDDDGNDRGGLASSAIAALSALEGDVGVPTLIELARNAREGTRRNAVFWLGQNASRPALQMLHTVIEDRDESDRVRAHAIFALAHGGDTPLSEFAWLRSIYSRLDSDQLKEAVFHGMSQDEDTGGRWLVERALDTQETLKLRKSALFWAGQREATPTADLIRVYRSAREQSLREHAIFVLSQRKDDAATDELLRIVREERETEMRGKALFWLAQKKDPRVQKLISDIILK